MVALDIDFLSAHDGSEIDPDHFRTEIMIRQKRELFRHYTFNIMRRRNLPLSMPAANFYLNLTEGSNKAYRKDDMTPREQHEESHVVTEDTILKIRDHSWIKPEKYGSIDTIIAALWLHDVIEDFRVPPNDIDDMLKEAVSKAPSVLKRQAEIDREQVLILVKIMSRKDENGINIDDCRIKQAEQWLLHPYGMPLKLIDWSNKLSTLVGVDVFESDGQKKLRKTLNETELLFDNEQQQFVTQAIEKWPFTAEPCNIMEGVIGLLVRPLKTYATLVSGENKF